MSISEPMHMPERVQRIEVFSGIGRRRSWTDEQKALIIAESYGAGETVCGVARRHGLTPQQLFTWRRQARRSAKSKRASPPLFVPAVVEAPVAANPVRRSSVSRRSRKTGCGASLIEVEISGMMVRVGRGADAKTIAMVIDALKAVR